MLFGVHSLAGRDGHHLINVVYGASTAQVVHGGGNQSAELRDAVVGVHHIVAHLQLVNLFQRDDGFPAAGVLARECHAVETLEYLMVGVAANLQSVIHKPLMQYAFHGDKGDW